MELRVYFKIPYPLWATCCKHSLGAGLSCLLMVFSLISFSAQAYNPNRTEMLAHELPQELEGVTITERLGEQVDLSIPFVADNGESVTLGRYFNGQKPVLFSIIYYNCPSLCNFHLNGLTEALRELNWTVGQDFDVVALSMDHSEGPELAAAKKASYIEEYGRPESASGWHFLTGTEDNIRKVADQVGFGFKWIEATEQFSHAAAGIVLTPGGQISRYLHGILFEPQTVRMSLLEASDGKIGSLVDQILMFCFQFNPAKNKYTLYAYNIMRIGGLVFALVLAIFLVPLWFRERYHHSQVLKGDR